MHYRNHLKGFGLVFTIFLTVCSSFFSRKMEEKMNSGGDQETKSHDERTEETESQRKRNQVLIRKKWKVPTGKGGKKTK